MKLSCLQENLARALSIVGRAIPSRTTLPITQNFLLKTEQSMLHISATDLEVAITVRIGAQVEEEGAITVPARLFGEFVNRMPPDRIDMETTDQPLGLNVKCQRSESNFNGMSAEDYPPIPQLQDGIVGKIESQTLRQSISHVAFAAATEDSRPVLTGVKVEISGDGITLAAADGFRLAVYKDNLSEPLSEDIEFLIPARTLNEISRMLPQQEQSIEFMVTPSNNQVLFRLDNAEVVSVLIQGSFPNYSQLIPQSHATRIEMRSNDFMSATRAAAIFARDGSGIIRLQVSESENGSKANSEMQVSSRAEEVGNYQGAIAVRVDGDDAKIAFNSKYLTDVLDVLSDSDVALEVSSPSSPGVIKPVEGEKYVHVVMPMFVQW